MKIVFLLCVIITSSLDSYSQIEELLNLETGSGNLAATLLLPLTKKKMPVALIIAGSGPTDRDGNNTMMKNNSLKLLASGLAEHGIASLRYDKRGVAASKGAAIKEADLRFDDYITDAKLWVDLLVKDKRFKNIIIIGHSQGSLIGMVACQQEGVNKFISIAGPGRPLAATLREQLAAQPPIVLEMAEPILKELEQSRTTEDVPPGLYTIFRPSVQPFMISWLKYDPAVELKKLQIPILIVQGTTDIQVATVDAEILAVANSEAKLSLIEGMNHVLKEVEIDRQKNIATYNNPELPLAKGLMDQISNFINQ